MREPLVRPECARPKASAVLFFALLTAVWPASGTGRAQQAKTGKAVAGGKPGAPADKKKPAPKKPEPKPVTLPNGHIGQEYETKIRGVMGLSAGEPHCTPVMGLPDGLELECGKMLIHGHPQATADGATVSFTVSDDDKNSVDLAFKLTVLDGPDVVEWVTAPAKTAKQANKGAGGAAKHAAAAAAAVEESEPSALASDTEAMEAGDEQAERSPAPVVAPVSSAASMKPAARVVPAVPMVRPVRAEVGTSGGEAPGPPKPIGEKHDGHHGYPMYGVGIEIDQETPVVEGATVIKGKIINDTEQVSKLCVALRQSDWTLTDGSGKHSYAALTSAKKNPCLAVETLVTDDEFTLTLISPVKAGSRYEFELRSATTDEAVDIKDPRRYEISLKLPKPDIEVTSLIRDGVSTISGTCKALPNPALTTDASAKPPVTGNLPRVVVELHEPNAPGGPKMPMAGGPGKGGPEVDRQPDGVDTEWHTADLLVGPTKSQTTAQSEEASATADGCTFSVMLKTPLAAGERVRVKLKAPAGRFFGDGPNQTEVVWPSPKPDERYGEAARKEKPMRGDKMAEKSEGIVVYTALAVAPPVITSQLVASAGSITGTATPSVSKGPTVNIAVVSDDDYHDLKEDSPNQAGLGADGYTHRKKSAGSKQVNACLTQDDAAADSGRFLPLTLTSGTGAFATTSATGDFTLKLATPLIEGQRFHVVEILPANSVMTEREKAECTTAVNEVKGELDWGRIHADFTAGVLISNDSTNSTTGATGAGSGNFSQAHQFYALTVEKSWSLPGCYLRVFSHRDENLVQDGTGTPATATVQSSDSKKRKYRKQDDAGLTPDQCYDWDTHRLVNARRVQHLVPGVSTYFQARLTAIPVSTLASGNTTTAAGTTTSTMPTTNLLTTAQTAKVEVGTYFPFLISRWEFDHRPNALFIAPLAKVGFNTVTGPSTVNTISASNAIQSQTFEQVYNFWSYGARVGHMELTHSQNRAPETYSYLDISIGPYSNLQSYICHSGTAPAPAAGTTSASTCAEYGTGLGIDSRKRLYRLDIEGLLKVPKTAFYLGLNANIGQKTLGTTHLDQGFAAPDDLRFFFGTKFDIASVLTKFKLGPQ